ncbi:MAG: MotA/TolQ/ExbB proton channel family protein [Planctomycetes bacterium]|nr:MotA/TolQ/ExbB proton channel family protein [Planctomycetota bacterium]
MIPILGVSVVGTTFVLERAWFWFVLWLRRDLRLRRRLLRGEVPPPGTRTSDPHALVLVDLAVHPSDPDLAVDRARMLVRDSRAHLKVLAICSGLGSALGLFGTVVGMSDSFRGVGLENPGAIVTGLQTALNTTVLGLIVYLTAYVAHALFAQMSTNLSQDLEEDLNEARRALDARRRGRVAA